MNQENSNNDTKTNFYFQSESLSYEQVYLLNGYPLISTEQLIESISYVLFEVIHEGDSIQSSFQTSFTGKSIPSITVKDYLLRIYLSSFCSQECFILALIYIDRITEKNKSFLLNSLNIHRILMTSVMIAVKFFDDRFYNNQYYSKVGGISIQEINILENEFLHLISYKLFISSSLYFKYRQKLLIAYFQQQQELSNQNQGQSMQIESQSQPQLQNVNNINNMTNISSTNAQIQNNPLLQSVNQQPKQSQQQFNQQLYFQQQQQQLLYQQQQQQQLQYKKEQQ